MDDTKKFGIMLSIDLDLNEELTAQAAKEDRSKLSVIRRAIRNYLDGMKEASVETEQAA